MSKILNYWKVKTSTWNGFSHKLHWLTWQIPHILQKTFLHVFSSNFRDLINSDRVKVGSLKEFNVDSCVECSFFNFANDKIILLFRHKDIATILQVSIQKLFSRYLCNNCRKLLWNFFKADVSIRVHCRQLKNRKQLNQPSFFPGSDVPSWNVQIDLRIVTIGWSLDNWQEKKIKISTK